MKLTTTDRARAIAGLLIDQERIDLEPWGFTVSRAKELLCQLELTGWAVDGIAPEVFASAWAYVLEHDGQGETEPHPERGTARASARRVSGPRAARTGDPEGGRGSQQPETNTAPLARRRGGLCSPLEPGSE